MNKVLSLVFLFVCMTQIGNAQDMDALKKSAIRDANRIGEATKSMDMSTILDYTHPNVLEISGGKDALLQQMAGTFDMMKSRGFKFDKVEILGVLEIRKEQDEYRCIVKNNNYMSIDGNKMLTESHLMGFYDKTNDKWTFIEAAKIKNEQARTILFPGFETSLTIPDDVQKRL